MLILGHATPLMMNTFIKKRLGSHFWNEPYSGLPEVFPGNPSNEFSDCGKLDDSGFWYWLRFPPGFAPSFMLHNSDCRCTRGYKIGHPCRDFRDLCACNACSSVRLYLLEAQANQLRQGFVDQGRLRQY